MQESSEMLSAQQIQQATSDAVSWFWSIRTQQADSQKSKGVVDHGFRGEVTGGAQMQGFMRFLEKLVCMAGVTESAVFRDQAVELPGYYRPTKRWDLLVVADGTLLAAVEAKAQVGPSFGNNFNNRAEEAIGSAVDLWTAYREGAFLNSPRPWLGYLFLLEDCAGSNSPVKVREPHFAVSEEFREASYMRRYELLCRKLVRERHYEASAFLASSKEGGLAGSYSEPAKDLTVLQFVSSLFAHVSAYFAFKNRS